MNEKNDFGAYSEWIGEEVLQKKKKIAAYCWFS